VKEWQVVGDTISSFLIFENDVNGMNDSGNVTEEREQNVD
jgi:hypothetical protein